MKIISLTSIPPRFPHLRPTLEALLDQGADEVRINVPSAYRRFPDWDGTLPDVPDDVTIARCDLDYGPATKILPTCREYRGRDVQILFCDDDGTFAKGWAQRLFQLQAARPGEAVAGYARSADAYVGHDVTLLKQPAVWQMPVRYDVPYRLQNLIYKMTGLARPWRRPFWRAGYGDVFFGVGGVVVKPDFFDDIAFDVAEEAWMVDDIWLSAQLARKKIPVYCPAFQTQPRAEEHSDTASLLDLQVAGQKRVELNCNAAKYCAGRFGIWNS